MSAEILAAEPQATVVASGADQPYWDALVEGRLVLQHCRACGRWHWPAVWRCGECGSWDQLWSEVQPRGEVYTWTRTWHPFAGAEAIGVPFVSLVVTVDQTQSRRLTGLLEGDQRALKIGARVQGRLAETQAAARRLPALRWSITS